MEKRECPLCKKVVPFGRVYLLFGNGDLWIVDAALGHLADCHNLCIPTGLTKDVLGQQILPDGVPSAINQQPAVELPMIFEEGRQRTVCTGFANRWDSVVRNALARMYSTQLFGDSVMN